MHQLQPHDIDHALRLPPSDVKPTLRNKIENAQQSLASGEGILPKIIGGAMAVPVALTNMKQKEVPIKTVNI